jgi:hypothetical protein
MKRAAINLVTRPVTMPRPRESIGPCEADIHDRPARVEMGEFAGNPTHRAAGGVGGRRICTVSAHGDCTPQGSSTRVSAYRASGGGGGDLADKKAILWRAVRSRDQA